MRFVSYQLHKVLAINMIFDLDLTLTYWSEKPIGIMDYLPIIFIYQLLKILEIIMTFDLSPTYLNINRDILLIKNYTSAYQVWCKVFWSYQMHKIKGDRHTDRRTDICKQDVLFFQRKKTKHTNRISSNSHPSATANKAIHKLAEGINFIHINIDIRCATWFSQIRCIVWSRIVI